MTPLEKGKMHAPDMPKYRTPQHQFIGSGRRTEELYRREEVRNKAIHACADEWAVLNDMEGGPAAYYRNVIPQALFDTLESFELPASFTAAEAFLKHYGFTVTRPK